MYTTTYSYELPPPRFDVPNKKVAVEPFPTVEKKAQVKGGVLVPMNQAALVPLKVVFDSEMYPVGAVVYVRSKLQSGSTYAQEIFEVEGQRFILIPEEEVVLADFGPVLAAGVEQN